MLAMGVWHGYKGIVLYVWLGVHLEELRELYHLLSQHKADEESNDGGDDNDSQDGHSYSDHRVLVQPIRSYNIYIIA